jgi:hypothetical protein
MFIADGSFLAGARDPEWTTGPDEVLMLTKLPAER